MEWSICGTRNSHQFISSGIQILSDGGTAIDAVETVIQKVEANKLDWSVGYNGFPNLLGEVELDASIMVGSSRKAGAVASVSKYLHVISLARKVMELSPHVLLVGNGAELFAKSIGFEEIVSLLDTEMKEYYSNIVSGNELLEGLEIKQEIKDLAWRYDKYITRQLEQFDYIKWYRELSKEYHGTVNVIAKDIHGEICSGVSTSGLALKFPGRAGDSPVIGAGNYADARFGAATCVGTGELAIRLGLARQAISYLEHSSDLLKSAKRSISDVIELNEIGVIQILMMDQDGGVIACSNTELEYSAASSQNPQVQKIKTVN